MFQHPTSQKEKEGLLKEAALVVYDNVSTEDAKSELLVAKKIKDSPLISTFCPKVHHIFEENGKAVVISKLANGGEMKNSFHNYSDAQKAEILSDVFEGVSALNDLGILHNDISMRNILLHNPQKWMAVDENLVGKIVSSPIYEPVTGRELYKKETILSEADVKQLKDWGIKKIKVSSGERTRALLTDFGIITMTENGKVIVDSQRLPHDVTAPELMIREGNKIIREKNAVPSEKSAIFSQSQLILDGYLNANRDTTMSKDGQRTEYSKNVAFRQIFRIENKNNGKVKTALETMEYEELLKIDKELANFVQRGLSYNPNDRPLNLKEFKTEWNSIKERLSYKEMVFKEFCNLKENRNASVKDLKEIFQNKILEDPKFEVQVNKRILQLEKELKSAKENLAEKSMAKENVKKRYLAQNNMTAQEFDKQNVPGSKIAKEIHHEFYKALAIQEYVKVNINDKNLKGPNAKSYVSRRALQLRLNGDAELNVKKRYMEQKNYPSEVFEKQKNIPGSEIEKEIKQELNLLVKAEALSIVRNKFMREQNWNEAKFNAARGIARKQINDLIKESEEKLMALLQTPKSLE